MSPTRPGLNHFLRRLSGIGMKSLSTSLVLALALPASALAADTSDTTETAAPAPTERIEGPVPAEVEAYNEALKRYRTRAQEFSNDARSYVDQVEREEREKITFGYAPKLDGLEAEKNVLRDEAIARFEAFLRKYPDGEYTAHVMFRLAELYFEQANVVWQEDAAAYALEEAAATTLKEQLALPPPPTRDYTRAIDLYLSILQKYPDYEYNDGVYYMLGYCYRDELSDRYFADDADLRRREYFGALVTQYPDSPFAVDGNFILGQEHFDNNEIEEAVVYFETVVATAPKGHLLYDRGMYMLAWSYYKLSNYEGALTQYTGMLDFSEEVLRESGQPSDLRPEGVEYAAISFADLADKSVSFEDPDWREYSGEDMTLAHDFLVGQLGMSDGMHTPVEVVDAWFAQVGERPYRVDIVKQLAATLVEYGRFEEAIATYEYIQSSWPNDPENPDYQFQVAVLYLNLPIPDPEASGLALTVLNERYSEGTSWWEANSKNPDAQARAKSYLERSLSAVAREYHIRAKQTGKIEDYAAAADGYEEYLDKFPFADDYYEIQWYLADSLYNAERYTEAIDQYLQLLKVTGHPYRDGSQFNLARAYQKVLEEKYGSPFLKPEDAVVREEVELPSGQKRTVYALSEEHLLFVAAADVLQGAEFKDEDWRKVLNENRAAFYYIPAQIYYEHGDYEEARKRLEKVIELYPNTEEGAFAARLIVNTYQADGDLEKVVELTRVYSNMRLGPKGDENVEVFKNLQEGARFKLAFALAESEEFLAAAAAYEELLRDYPKSENYAISLYNAANNYEKGGKAEQANDLFERYINEFPRDERSKALYFRIAGNYASVLELDKAVDYYEKLYLYFGKNEAEPYVDAGPALYNAAFLRIGMGDYVGAAQNFEEYQRKFTDAPDAEAAYWQAGEQWKKVGDKYASDFYTKKYLPKYGVTGSVQSAASTDHIIDARYFVVQYYTGKGDTRNANKAWDALMTDYNALAAKGAMGSVARNRAAEGAFRELQSMYDDFIGDPYPSNEDKLVEFLISYPDGSPGDKVVEYKAIEKKCIEIIETYQDFEYSTAAIYIWGSTYIAYADYLYDAPVPRAFAADPDLEIIFLDKMAEQAQPIEEKGITRFQQNLEKAKNEKRSSVWIDRTMVALNDINPSEYALEKTELRGSTDPTVIPQSGGVEEPEAEPEAVEPEAAPGGEL